MTPDAPHADISLSALAHNVAYLRARLRPGAELLVAVKADAYGHGAAALARHLAALGVGWFGVATREEALELRRAGLSARILIFGPVYEGLDELIAEDIALTVVDAPSAEAVIRAARGRAARLHLKLDTGMGRLGQGLAETLQTAERLDRARGVVLEALWTHFAASDEADRSFTDAQLTRFHEALAALARAGVQVPLKHTANSAALLRYPESHFDLVRPGIAVYGYHSSDTVAACAPGLVPIMTLTAPVTFVKRVRAGTPVSYGGLWTAPKDTTVATVRFGYADGYPRALSNRAHVKLSGVCCPIAGRVCMDQLMVDVGASDEGDLDVQVGDRATLWDAAGPTAETLGRAAGTISYELLTRVGARVARRYSAPAP